MSEQANVALVFSLYDAFRRGDTDSIMNSLDPNVVWESDAPPPVPYGGTFHGPEETKKFFDAIGSTMTDIRMEMKPFAAQGDNVVTFGRYAARITATGKRVDVPLVHLWTIRNGKVVFYQNFGDTAAVAEAYGVTAAGAR